MEKGDETVMMGENGHVLALAQCGTMRRQQPLEALSHYFHHARMSEHRLYHAPLCDGT